MIRKLLAVVLAAISLVSAPALAQSSATPVLPGMLVTSGCPSGVTACWVPYSNSNPLPVTGGGGGGGTTMTATAAAPSYTEGSTNNPLSSNLTGDLRVIAKQNGTWNVGLNAGANTIGAISNTSFASTQSGTWNINNVSGTVSLPTNAAQETGGNLATIATQQTAASTAVGSQADATCGTGSGTCSLIALIKYLNTASTGTYLTTSGGTTLNVGSSPGDAISNTGSYLTVANHGYGYNNSTWDRFRTIQGADGTGLGIQAMATSPNSNANSALVPVVSTTLESCHVLKASAGNLYSLAVTIQATTVIVQVFNATSAPGDGAVTPIWSMPVISNGTLGGNSWNFAIPVRGSTGLTVCASSATTPFTKTASATAMFSAEVQ